MHPNRFQGKFLLALRGLRNRDQAQGFPHIRYNHSACRYGMHPNRFPRTFLLALRGSRNRDQAQEFLHIRYNRNGNR